MSDPTTDDRESAAKGCPFCNETGKAHKLRFLPRASAGHIYDAYERDETDKPCPECERVANLIARGREVGHEEALAVINEQVERYEASADGLRHHEPSSEAKKAKAKVFREAIAAIRGTP